MSGTLFICSLPIGNLGDISQRIIDILTKVDLIVSEDTRNTGLLLSKLNLKKKLISYHDFSKPIVGNKLIELLQTGNNLALVSDAGTPLISDPGYHLLQKIVEANIPIDVIPGPTALITALVASGLPTDRFCFEGFLKNKSTQRKKQLENLKNEPRTIIFYESPYRLIETLSDILEILGNRKCFIGRELTKKYQEYLRGPVTEIIEHFQKRKPRGEMVLIIEGIGKK